MSDFSNDTQHPWLCAGWSTVVADFEHHSFLLQQMAFEDKWLGSEAPHYSSSKCVGADDCTFLKTWDPQFLPLLTHEKCM